MPTLNNRQTGENKQTVEAHDLYRFYHTEHEETLALKGVTFKVSAGEIVAIVGPSGSGKSTLLSCISGIDEPDGGYVLINGERLTRKSEVARAQMRSKSIGMVMQNKNLMNHLTLNDNIKLKMYLNHKVDQAQIDFLLEQVELSHRKEAYPLTISGGEAARAALAVALATSPSLLIADEPTSEIDLETEQKILDVFRLFKNNGGAIIIATHSNALASFSDRVLTLHDGRMIC